ncbi:MAG: DoxX family protein [Patescibacteria group bacterium]
MFAQTLQYSDIGLFVLRFAVGIIFIVHAIPKFKHPKDMALGIGISGMSFMIVLLGLVEMVSALYLIFGFYTQLGALLLSCVMVGAITIKITKWGVPFSTNDKMGWEFDLVLLAANIAILLVGGGSLGIQQ